MDLSTAARRAAYRSAHRALRIKWFLTRPHLNGVKCVLTDGDRVLLVRHTYGDRRWDLPGGRVNRREQPLAAARREIAEELGLQIEDWQALGDLAVRLHHRHDTIHLFTAPVRDPGLTLDLGELDAARWFPRAALPADLAAHTAVMLARADAPGPG